MVKGIWKGVVGCPLRLRSGQGLSVVGCWIILLGTETENCGIAAIERLCGNWLSVVGCPLRLRSGQGLSVVGLFYLELGLNIEE